MHIGKHPGNGAVAIRQDGRVCAVGGWDGKLVCINPWPRSHLFLRIRLYSTKKFKALGTLTYHKDGCSAVYFARPVTANEAKGEEDLEEDEIISRGLWLASGGKDSRICIWPLASFEKKAGG